MEALYRAKRMFDSLPRFIKAGLPFFCFMVGGSFYLREFAQLRYEFRSQKRLDPEELKAHGIKMKPSPTIEEVYEEIKDLDTDNWENIRGPRPHEEGADKIVETLKAKAIARRKQTIEEKMNRIRNA